MKEILISLAEIAKSKVKKELSPVIFLGTVLLLALSLAMPALAITHYGVFELDGNAIDNQNISTIDDWNDLFGTVIPPNHTANAVAQVFINDTPISGFGDPYFTGGGSKDINDITNWLWTNVSAPQNKVELNDSYAAAYNVNGNFILEFGTDRIGNNGDANEGFWFFQRPISLNPNGTFNGNHTNGDIFILSEFTTGGVISNISVYKWNYSNLPNHLDLQSIPGIACQPGFAPGNTNLCSIVNTNSTPSPWPYAPVKNIIVNNNPQIFPFNTFMEGGLNVSALLPATVCFSTFMAETRSSQSISSTLSDFMLGQFNLCGARVSIGPNGTNEVNKNHTLTGHVDTKTSVTSFTPASGAIINFTISSGPGSLNPASCTTGADGNCSVNLTSSITGTTVISASTNVTMGGSTFSITTDGIAPDSGPAFKHWVDANITIAPQNATNAVGTQHNFTITVTALPDDASPVSFNSITTSISPTPTSSSDNCANPTINGNTATCTLTINSNSAGTFTANATAQITMGGATVTRSTAVYSGPGGSGPATKTYVDANIQINPPTASNEINAMHTLTGHINVNDGTGFVNVPDGTIINFSINSGPGFLNPTSCTTSGGTGNCSVNLTSSTPGITNVSASTNVTISGVTLTRTTNGQAGNSGPALKSWVDANIQISPPTASNEINAMHTLTGHVNVNSGTGYVNAPDGTTINFSINSGPGTLNPTSCITSGGTGNCSVNLTSSTPGTTNISASTTIVVSDVSFTRTTDGLANNSGPALKNWVDANIQISPPTASNEINAMHTLTGHVNVNDGTGFVNAPDGTTISFSINSGPGTLNPTSCTTSGGTGNCSVTLTSSTTGITNISSSTNVTISGVLLTRTTNGQAGNSGPALKKWVDANIQISPPTASNEIGNTHTLTGHVNVNSGTGFVNVPDGTTISFNINSGPGTLNPTSCTTSGGTGNCSVTLTSSTTGITNISASTTVTVSGVTLTRTTDGLANNSDPALKNWVDANIQISPPTASNEINAMHILTGHVNVNSGTGYINAPDGTTINFSINSGPGTLNPTSCTTSGGTGNCSVNLTSSTTGITNISASTNVTVSGVTLTRTTNGQAGNSGPALKKWVDANIQINPPTGTNGINEPHALTGHVNVNNGTGYVSAPDGTTISFSINSGPGFLNPTSCTTSGGTGNCSVTLTSSTTGTTNISASTTVVVSGVTLTRTTNSLAGDSGQALKNWVAGSLTWFKQDNSGNLLAGATFSFCRVANFNSTTGLYDPITPVCAPVTDNLAPDVNSTGGVFQIINLTLGIYNVTETAAPDGYTIVNPNPVTAPGMTLTNPDVTITTPFVNIPPQVAQITPTGTNCSQYISGTASTLAQLNYSIKSGAISQVDPGVFFYFNNMTLAASTNIINITQFNLLNWVPIQPKINQISLYNSACTKVSETSSVNSTTGTATMNTSVPAGSYVVQIQYDSTSLVGQFVGTLPFPTNTYNFQTYINSTFVPGSNASINVVPK